MGVSLDYVMGPLRRIKDMAKSQDQNAKQSVDDNKNDPDKSLKKQERDISTANNHARIAMGNSTPVEGTLNGRRVDNDGLTKEIDREDSRVKKAENAHKLKKQMEELQDYLMLLQHQKQQFVDQQRTLQDLGKRIAIINTDLFNGRLPELDEHGALLDTEMESRLREYEAQIGETVDRHDVTAMRAAWKQIDRQNTESYDNIERRMVVTNAQIDQVEFEQTAVLAQGEEWDVMNALSIHGGNEQGIASQNRTDDLAGLHDQESEVDAIDALFFDDDPLESEPPPDEEMAAFARQVGLATAADDPAAEIAQLIQSYPQAAQEFAAISPDSDVAKMMDNAGHPDMQGGAPSWGDQGQSFDVERAHQGASHMKLS